MRPSRATNTRRLPDRGGKPPTRHSFADSRPRQAGPAASPQAPTRLDSATSYQNQEVVGAAVAASGVPRENLWLLSKVGPSQPLGHDDALAEFKTIQAALQTDYVDALLVHWPFQNPSAGNVTTNVTVSSDPACQHKNPAFNATRCRLDTWRALVEIYESGGAKSIGVSNYGIAELTEIIDAGLPLPALNQCPFHIYRSSNQAALRAFCEAHGILFIGYSPLGVPDWHDFSPDFAGAPHTQLQDEVVLEVAANHPGFTPAQVLLAWQWAHGVPFNPRTTSREHMEENIRSFNLKLSDDEVAELDARPNPTCAQDPW